MALLIARSRPRPEPPPAPASTLPAISGEEWRGIYGEGRKIGYAHRVRSPTADGFAIAAESAIELRLMGAAQSVRTRWNADTDRALRLRGFDFRLRSGTIDVSMSGAVRGDRLEVNSDALGALSIELPPSGSITLSETLQDVLAHETLEPGRTLRYALFDPLSAAPASVSLTVGPLERVVLPSGVRFAHRVDEEFQGSRFRLWVEPGVGVIREEGPLGLTIVRETDGRAALAGLEPGAGIDLASAAAIPVARVIGAPRSTRRLRLRISDAPADHPLSFPPRQRRSGTELLLEREDPATFRSFPLPNREARFADDLRATPFLQTGDARVGGAAREALGGEGDAARAAQKLLLWVYRSLAKVPTVSVPNALQVLEQRRGDCNEHAVLYAALARAAGLPARIASGAVYMPGEGGAAGAFYYHAWNEVWLGEWVAVDPTFGQFPADATHVKLAEGGPDKDVALLGMIGRLRLEVEDAS
ncbi:MAG: transglutaminase domain-containing protein [Deltaproteobacteria bacterium]|nr:transglutaminase domain-containing protein [Deltaproteobacteria bacterium]